MLAVVLTILKIIGLVLLGILGLLLLILLIALFVPVRYKAKGSYEDKVFLAKAQASYLLHIVSVKVSYDKKIDFKIKLFGFTLGAKKKKDKPAKKKEKIKTKSESNTSDNGVKLVESSDLNNFEVFESENTPENKDDDLTSDSKEEKATSASDKTTTSKNEDKKKVKKDKNDKKDKDESKTEKLNDFKAKFEEYRALLEKKSTQDALALCKDRIGKLLRSILPRKGAVNLYIGLENAGITGKIMGAYYALYAYIGRVVHITPYYDEKVLKGDFNFKGRIRLAPVLYHLACIYFNKNCNRLIKKFLKKGKA